MKILLLSVAFLIPTMLLASNTNFEFNDQTYSVDVKNVYCAPPKGSEYEKMFKDIARTAIMNAVPVNLLTFMPCDGVKITKGNNRVFSSFWIKPFVKSSPNISDEDLQSLIDENLKKSVTNAFKSDKLKDYQQALSEVTGILVEGKKIVYEVQSDPAVVLLVITKSKIGDEEFTNMTFGITRALNNRIFHFYISDSYEYQLDIDHVDFLTDMAMSLEVKK